MEEYLTDRCSTCGHEKRGKRVIRLSGEHAKQWKKIQRQLAINEMVTFLGVLLSLVSGIGAGLAAWWYLPPYWSEEARMALSFVTWFLGLILPLFLVLIPLLTRRGKAIYSQQDTILANYGIMKDSGEPYVVVTE